MEKGYSNADKLPEMHTKLYSKNTKRGDIEDRCRSQNNDKIDMKQKGWQGVKWIQPAQYKDHAFVILLLSFRVECEVSGLH
jgi:hypothetical protein